MAEVGEEARARLVAAGGPLMSDAELLAFVLADGRWSGEARDRAERLLARGGGVARLERVLEDPGSDVPLARRLLLLAAIELGRRAAAMPLSPGFVVRDAATIHAHFRGRLPQLAHECFHVVLLDGRNRYQGDVRVSEGSLTTALVHPREVFGPAIRLRAAAIVLVHNHPSGDPTPSPEDVALTERLRHAGEIVGIRVLDHVVVGQARFVSMAETGRW